MAQALSTYQIFDLYSRHPDLREAAAEHEDDVLPTWNQVYAAYGDSTTTATTLWELVASDLRDLFGRELPVPPRGLTVDDETYGRVFVFPDAAGILHFSRSDNEPLAAAIEEPMYREDENYWELFQDIAARYGEALDLGLTLAPIAAAVFLGLVVTGGIRGRR